MLMALRFECSRFFLKGKVWQEKTSYTLYVYIHVHEHTVREEVSQVCVISLLIKMIDQFMDKEK